MIAKIVRDNDSQEEGRTERPETDFAAAAAATATVPEGSGSAAAASPPGDAPATAAAAAASSSAAPNALAAGPLLGTTVPYERKRYDLRSSRPAAPASAAVAAGVAVAATPAAGASLPSSSSSPAAAAAAATVAPGDSGSAVVAGRVGGAPRVAARAAAASLLAAGTLPGAEHQHSYGLRQRLVAVPASADATAEAAARLERVQLSAAHAQQRRRDAELKMQEGMEPAVREPLASRSSAATAAAGASAAAAPEGSGLAEVPRSAVAVAGRADAAPHAAAGAAAASFLAAETLPGAAHRHGYSLRQRPFAVPAASTVAGRASATPRAATEAAVAHLMAARVLPGAGHQRIYGLRSSSAAVPAAASASSSASAASASAAAAPSSSEGRPPRRDASTAPTPTPTAVSAMKAAALAAAMTLVAAVRNGQCADEAAVAGDVARVAALAANLELPGSGAFTDLVTNSMMSVSGRLDRNVELVDLAATTLQASPVRRAVEAAASAVSRAEGHESATPPPTITDPETSPGVSDEELQTKSYTYIALYDEWEDHGCIRLLKSIQDAHPHFTKFWIQAASTLQQLKLRVRPCGAERDKKAYGAMARVICQILSALYKVVHGQRHPHPPCCVVEPTAHNRTRPDVALFGFLQEKPGPELIYALLKLAVEFKEKGKLSSSTIMGDGLGQLISRAGEARDKQNRPGLMLPGALCDGVFLVPATVRMKGPLYGYRMHITDAPLRLYNENAQQDNVGCFKVDTSMPAFKELALLVFLAMEQDLRASAECHVRCFKDGQVVAVRNEDGRSSWYKVTKRLCDPRPAGCAYAVTPVAGSGASCMLKVGPPLRLLRQAEGMCLPMEEWRQVAREGHILSVLGEHSSRALPVLVDRGVLELEHAALEGGNADLAGASVVVTTLLGEALVPSGATRQQACDVATAEQITFNLSDGLAVMQPKGILYNDMHQRNMGKRTDGGGYYMYDFGSSSTVGELQQHQQDGTKVVLPIDLRYSAMELLSAERIPGPLSDMQSLLFCAFELAGFELPWADSADHGNVMECLIQRKHFMAAPSELPGWDQFSPAFQQLASSVFSHSLASRDVSIRELVDRARGRTAAAREPSAAPASYAMPAL